MESVTQPYASRLESGTGRQVVRPCWEILRCARVTCPAHSQWEDFCWRLPGTGCRNDNALVRQNKVESCLVCPVFKLNADAHAGGWNEFVAAEIAYLIQEKYEPFPPVEKICRDVLNKMPYGVLLTDKHNKVRYVNAAAERATGLSGRDMAGKKYEELLDGLAVSGNLAGRHGVFSWLPEDSNIDELEITRADGQVVPVVRTSYPLKDESGALLARAHLLEDTSYRRRLQDDLRQSENSYRRLFEESKDMIFIHSRGSILRNVNQACVETLGYSSKNELLSLASVERIYVNPIHRKVFQEQVDRYGFVRDFETTFRKRDGTRIYCLVSGTAVRDKDDNIIGYETIAKDITARMDGVRSLQQQHRELSLLHSVAVSMNVTHELDEILSVALKKVLDVLNITTGAVFLINHEKSDFVLKAHRGLPKRLVGGSFKMLLHDHELMEFLLKADRSLRPQHTFPPFTAVLEGMDGEVLKLLCFLITTKEKASGFIALEVSSSRSITDRDHQMLGSLGNFLGGAIENADLLRTIRQHREELKGLTARLFHSQEEERKRIAQELHDEAGQALTGIHFTLETVINELPPQMVPIREGMLEVKKQIHRTYQELRRISHRLHPAVLSDLGLEPALEYRLGRIAKHTQIQIDFKMIGFEERMDPDVEMVLYRISQEAINNAVKHSGAKHFRISIIKSFPNIIFLAEDDGVGFDPHRPKMHGQALGLLCMRERAATVGGTFSLRTATGKGTRIRIEIPIKESPSNGEGDQDFACR